MQGGLECVKTSVAFCSRFVPVYANTEISLTINIQTTTMYGHEEMGRMAAFDETWKGMQLS